jgi:outer membrane protein OmpA-like peptidoglycan-associated protein
MLFRYVFLLLTVCALSACAGPKPIPATSMEFELGMKALADNLAGQLEKSGIGNMFNKVVVNPLTNKGTLKKIVIDPFIDTESGYPVKVNPQINAIMAGEIAKRFAVTGEMEPKNLEVSEYVLCGMVTLVDQYEGERNVYKVYTAVFEKSSGVVLASAEAYIRRFETTPMDIYRDSPIYLKGQNYEEHVSSIKKKPKESVETGYHDKLAVKSMRVKGDALYEVKEYNKSLDYYNQAATSPGGQEMETLNGLFTNLVHQGRYDTAEPVYGKLLKLSIAETGQIATKITFSPNSRTPVASKSSLYTIYVRQIAKLVAVSPACRVTIIGHSSRTGSEGYNDKLSLQRSASIQKLMSSFDPDTMKRSEIIGRGFRDNIVGTGSDDLTDEIDRRVEFRFKSCDQEK